jgi:hypothetical protein
MNAAAYINYRRNQEKKSKNIAETVNLLDDCIERMEKMNNFFDVLLYINKKYKKRKFIHKKTGFEYELNHFVDFKIYRKEIINDYKDTMYPYIFIFIMTICMISFAIYMCFHS